MEKENSKLFKSNAPELLQNLAAHVAKSAVDVLGVDAAPAEHLGQEVAMRVSKSWGGQLIYLPSAKQLQVAKTHMEIFRDFNGRNHNELASKYNLSVQHIYQVVKEVKKTLLKDIQADLFE